MTIESLPPENSSTGRSNWPTTSRMMWIDSSSRSVSQDRSSLARQERSRHSRFSLRNRAIRSSTASSTVLSLGVDAKFGMGRFLVLAIDSGETAQITGPLPGVEALDVALGADLDRRRDVDLEERDAGLVVGARTASRAAANGDTTAARTSTPWLASQQLATQPIRATLDVAVGSGVSEFGRQHRRARVAVEDLDRDPVSPQAVGERGGDRGLAGTGQPGEPKRGPDGRGRPPGWAAAG